MAVFQKFPAALKKKINEFVFSVSEKKRNLLVWVFFSTLSTFSGGVGYLTQNELIKKDGQWESFKILVLLGLVFL